MQNIKLMLLRGVCQTPAYAACCKGFFEQEGLAAQFKITPTAWMVPQQLASGDIDFSVLPWTRVAVAEAGEAPLRVVCGSGYDAVAIAAPLIGVNAAFTAAAIRANPPNVDGVRNTATMRTILEFMKSLGYMNEVPEGFTDLRFMNVADASV